MVAATMPCMTCQKLVHRPPSRIKRQKAIYCSYSCRSKTFADRCRSIAHKGRAGWTEESKEDLRRRFTGPTNPAWKGGVCYRERRGNYGSTKYVRCPPEALPMARKDGYVMEHRLVMFRRCRFHLTRTECVHHMDHNPKNNEPMNLELWPDNRSHKMAEHGLIAEGAANRWSLGG